MKKEIFVYAVQNLLHRKLRSWLTVLSILIGIMAIFAIISFGFGVQKYVNDLSDEMGVNKLIIQPKGFTPPGASSVKFGESELRAIRNVKGIDVVTSIPMQSSEIKINVDERGEWVYVMGVPTKGEEVQLMEETYALDIEKGRQLRSGDVYKAVVGHSYSEDNILFDKALNVRNKIYINDIPFKIVGFYESIGNPSDDKNVYISKEIFKEVFETDEFEYILASVQPDRNVDSMVEKVEKAVRKDRGLKKSQEDFFVQTFADAIAVFSNVLAVLNGVLVLIALISVVVSAVNIANAMYTAVLERTREIGVMKAIGAKNKNILNLFLVESGLLGLTGGALGIILGYLIAETGGKFAANAGYSMLQPYFPWWLIVGCLLFSFFVGMGSGYFPAEQASRLKPVDALRYE